MRGCAPLCLPQTRLAFFFGLPLKFSVVPGEEVLGPTVSVSRRLRGTLSPLAASGEVLSAASARGVAAEAHLHRSARRGTHRHALLVHHGHPEGLFRNSGDLGLYMQNPAPQALLVVWRLAHTVRPKDVSDVHRPRPEGLLVQHLQLAEGP